MPSSNTATAPTNLSAGSSDSVEAGIRPRSIWLPWVLLRVPVLLVIAFVARSHVVRVIESIVDIHAITEQAISVLGTFYAGTVYFALCSAALLLCVLMARRAKVNPTGGYLISVAIATAIFLASMKLTGRNHWYVVGVGLGGLFAINTVPAGWFDRLSRHRLAAKLLNVYTLVGVGIVELFTPRVWFQWLIGAVGGKRSGSGVASALPVFGAAIMLAGFATVSLRGAGLMEFDRRLHAEPAVDVLARGDFNWIALDPTGQYLYACGHEFHHLLRYSLADLTQPPLQSSEEVGRPQAFAYDVPGQRLFVLNPITNEALAFDATTMQLSQRIATLPVSEGDSWLVYEPGTDRLLIASEADKPEGDPFVVVQRADGKVVDAMDEDPGNVLMHPDKPWVYLSYFRRRTDLLVYDMVQAKIIKQVPADERSERMAFWKAGNELLVTSPMKGNIQRFDADTLAAKGTFPTLFGGRALAIDQERDLLVVGSLATSKVKVIDLKTYQTLATFHVGPWLRTVILDTERGVAYVSSNGAIYRLNYLTHAMRLQAPDARLATQPVAGAK